MQKLDKIFAGLILVAMMLFWVIISPAAVTSRVSEAKPISLEQSTTSVNAPLTREEQREKTNDQRVDQSIARLKQRHRDTPRNTRKDIDVTVTEDLPMPKLSDIEQDLSGTPGQPTFY